MGMDGLYKVLEADEFTSMYHITGFSGADFKVRRYMAVTLLAARPTERVLRKIMKDDRVLRQAKDFEETLEAQLIYIETLPSYCFERLRRILGDLNNGYSADDLLHDCLMAAHISIAYVWSKLLYLLQRMPFSLTQGDIEHNLEVLFATPEGDIKDPLALCIFRLHGLSMSTLYLKRCLELLRDAACTTNMVEQGHGSGSVLMKDHRTLQERTLRARSTIHQARSLFTCSLHEALLKKLQSKLDVVMARVPQVSGFRTFCRSVPEAEVREVLRGVKDDFDDNCTLTLADRRLVFSSFPVQVQMQFVEESKRLVDADVAANRLEADALREKIRVTKQQHLDELNERGFANHLSECKLGDEALQGACDIFNSINWRKLEQLRTVKLESPNFPGVAEQELIIGMEDELSTIKREVPWFCRDIIRNRDLWRMVALATDPDPQVAFLVLLAVQRPYEAVFLELRRAERVFDHERVGGGVLPRHFKTFDKFPLKHYIEDDVPIDADGDIWVFPVCRFDSGGVICGGCERYEFFVSRHPRANLQPSGRSNRSVVQVPRDESARVLLENPFLTQEDIDRALGKKPKVKQVRRKKARIAGKKLDEPSEDSAVSSDDVSDGFDDLDEPMEGGGGFDMAELEALREDYREEDEVFKNFYVHLRAGPYIWEHEKVISNCASAMARGAWVKYWCDSFSWQHKYQFHFSVYGQDDAVELAREVCRRGDFFFDIWMNQEDEQFLYTEEHLGAYEETLPFLDFVVAKAVDSDAFIRALEVRNIFPINPEWVE